MRICVIANPNSGRAAEVSRFFEDAAAQGNVSLMLSQSPGDIPILAARAAEEGYEIVAAAGGDGTISEVINGLYPRFRSVTLAVLPLGTGNDLARTLGISEDPVQALEAIASCTVGKMDLLRVVVQSVNRHDDLPQVIYCANAAVGGFGGQADKLISPDMKKNWGPLAYLMGGLGVLGAIQSYRTEISWDGEEPEVLDTLNLIVANGRSVAGGFAVAPVADLEDGKADVVVVRDTGVLEMAGVAAKLMAGNWLEHPSVIHRRVSKVSFKCEPGMQFNVDGELVPLGPISFEVIPSAMNVVVGENYRTAAISTV